MDVRTILRRSAAMNHDRVAVVADGRRLTFDEMWQRGVRLANGLLALGLEPQDRIGTLEDNGLGAADTFVGAAAANLVRVPLYARNARHAHAVMLNNVGARALLVDAAHLAEVDQIAAEVPTLEHVIVRDEGYEDWLAAQSDVDPDPAIADHDLYIIRHTGGTTGAPKPVPNSHRTWIACGRDYFYPLPPPSLGDVIVHAGPLSHASGYWLLPAVGGRRDPGARGGPRAGGAARCDGARGRRLRVPGARDARPARSRSRRAERDWSKAKALLMSGAPITERTIAQARSVFGDHALYQLFGQTETGAVAVMSPREWFADVPGSNPLRACGTPAPVGRAGDPRRERPRPCPSALRARSRSAATASSKASTARRRRPPSDSSTAGFSPATSAGSTRTATSTWSIARTTRSSPAGSTSTRESSRTRSPRIPPCWRWPCSASRTRRGVRRRWPCAPSIRARA